MSSLQANHHTHPKECVKGPLCHHCKLSAKPTLGGFFRQWFLHMSNVCQTLGVPQKMLLGKCATGSMFPFPASHPYMLIYRVWLQGARGSGNLLSVHHSTHILSYLYSPCLASLVLYSSPALLYCKNRKHGLGAGSAGTI